VTNRGWLNLTTYVLKEKKKKKKVMPSENATRT